MPIFFTPFPRRCSNGHRTLRSAVATGLLLSVVGCSTTSSTLNGAGASFPAPIYQRWFQELAGQGVRVNYQSIGSGAGVRQFLSRTVDFAASDVPMGAEEVAKVPQGVVQIPMTAGAIAVAYNHRGCDLKLNPSQLVGIFQGQITNFSQLGCAAKPIKVVVRSDGSGTTANFTAHLSAIDGGWKGKVGAGKSVKWPVGTGAKGNEGVAAQISQLEGALGYVEAAFVKPPLQAAALKNGQGRYVRPEAEEARAALDSIDLGMELTGSNPNPAVGYPIVSFSWILLYRSGNGPRLEPLKKVFTYTLSNAAQGKAEELGFLQLPAALLGKGRLALTTLQP